MQKLVIYILMGLFLINMASASFISLTTQITVNGSLPNSTSILINIMNNGDEPATAIQPEIEFNSHTFTGEAASSLDPKSAHSWSIQIKSDSNIPGRYPLILRTNYYDINNYAFSSISPTYVTIKEDTSPLVFGKLDNLEMTDQGKLHLQIINLDDKQKEIRVKLYLPRELTSDKKEFSLVMPPASKKDEEFNIERFSALPRSNYVVAAVIEYDENNKHYSNILKGSIKLVDESSSIKSPSTILIVVIIIVVFIISIILIERKRRKRLHKGE